MDRFRFCMTFIEQKLNVEICMAFVVRLQTYAERTALLWWNCLLWSQGFQTPSWCLYDCQSMEWKDIVPLVVRLHRCCVRRCVSTCWFTTTSRSVASGQWPCGSRWAFAAPEVGNEFWLFQEECVCFPIPVIFHIFSSLGFPMVCRFEQRLQSNFNIFCKSDLALQHPPTLFTTM